jgi:hypothetical protein
MEIKGTHGTADTIRLAPGLCIADDTEAARQYALRAAQAAGIDTDEYEGAIYTITIDVDGLRVLDADSDRDAQYWPGDADLSTIDADIVRFADETEQGRAHTTYRLVTDRAVAQTTYQTV